MQAALKPRAARLLAGAALTVGVAACSTHADTPSAREGADPHGSGVGVSIRVGQPSTMQAGYVCTTGTVRITRITPVMAVGKLTVTDWGVRNLKGTHYGDRQDPAAARLTVSDLPGFRQGPFDAPCPDGGHGTTEIDITTTASTPVAKVSHFIVHYLADGARKAYLLHVTVAMCAHRGMCAPVG